MNRTQLNRALTGIDDRYLTMVDRKTEEVQTMRQKKTRTKKLFRTILIAAAIMALMGITAYAVSSIHAARQQALRADLQIQENSVSGYTEYPERGPDPAAAPSTTAETRPAEPKIQLISSLQQGDFQAVYFSLSPVPEERARSFFFDNMVTEFSYIASNEEIPEDCWYTAGRIEEGIEKSFAHPVPFTEGHEAEHMVEQSSPTGLPDENGVQQTVTFEVVDPDWYRPRLMEHSYDPETQSLMLTAMIYLPADGGFFPAGILLGPLPGRAYGLDGYGHVHGRLYRKLRTGLSGGLRDGDPGSFGHDVCLADPDGARLPGKSGERRKSGDSGHPPLGQLRGMEDDP